MRLRWTDLSSIDYGCPSTSGCVFMSLSRTACCELEDRGSGGMSTTVAAYIAQARGSGEPDLSKSRVKKLNQFLRECHAFVDDHGTDFAEKDDDPLNHQLHDLRKKFEDLLGNTDG